MPDEQPEAVDHILVLALDRLGDTLQATPTLQALRARFRDASIDLYALQPYKEAFDGCPYVTRFVPISPPHLVRYQTEADRLVTGATPSTEVSQLVETLRGERYDLVVNLVASGFAAWLAGASGARFLVGNYVLADGRWLFEGQGFVYQLSLLDFRDENPFNFVDLYRVNVLAEQGMPTLYVNVLEGYGPASDGRPIIAINPGSSRAERRWPLSSFSTLIDTLHQDGLRVVLVGSAVDLPICEAVAEACKERPEFAVGTLSISQMAGWFRTVACVVANDTGALHVAAAAGSKTVGIYGSQSRFVETAPFASGHLLIEPKPMNDGARPLANVDPASVRLAILHQLGRVRVDEATTHWHAADVIVARTKIVEDSVHGLGGIVYERLTSEEPNAAALIRTMARPWFAARWVGAASTPETLAKTLQDQLGAPTAKTSALATELAAGCTNFANSLSRLGYIWDTLAALPSVDDATLQAANAVEEQTIASAVGTGTQILPRRASWLLKMIPFTDLPSMAADRRRILGEVAEDAHAFANALALWIGQRESSP